MAFFTVYTPPADQDPVPLARAVVIRDSFSVMAFVFTGLWLLSKRLWLAFFLFALVYGALVALQNWYGLPGGAVAIAQLAIGVFLGLEGPNLWGRKLLANGWSFADVVEGVNQDQAERRFFERALTAGPAPVFASAPASESRAPLRGGQGVIGVFPEAGGR